MKKLFIFAASAALFAACSQSDDLAQTPPLGQQQVDEVPVEFDVYVGKNTTRAGAGGVMTLGTGLMNLKAAEGSTSYGGGFGLFSYYTDDELYSQRATPNFMYNQGVFWKETSNAWLYSPVKYWPNEFGSDAISNATDYLSFFAYAPFVPVNQETGLVDVSSLEIGSTPAAKAAWKEFHKNYNIIQLSKNTAAGDPIVKYRVDTDPATSVDLLWGVQPYIATPDETDYRSITGDYAYSEGLPWMNLIKAKDAAVGNGKVAFKFHHALSKLNVQIDTDINVDNHPNQDVNDSSNDSEVEDIEPGDETTVKTKVYVRSVTFEGFALEGALNLHSTEASGSDDSKVAVPLWKAIDGTSILASTPATFYDCLQDGAEATTKNSSEGSLSQLNPTIIQAVTPITGDNTFWEGTKNTLGVRKAEVNLFAKRKWDTDKWVAETTPAEMPTVDAPIFVIPNGAKPKVTIVYDVETIDKKLTTFLSDGKTHGSSVENKITKPLTIDKFEAGKGYTIKLHLGLTSVKVDATVNGWTVDGSTDVTLPYNGYTP